MKNYPEALIFLAFFVLFISCDLATEKKNKDLYKKHTGYTINGTLSKGKATYVYLVDQNDTKVDSARINKHSFVLKGTIKSPDKYYLQLEKDTKQHPIILENSNYKMLLNGEKAMIIGGKLHSIYNDYQNEKVKYAMLKSNYLAQFHNLDVSLSQYLKRVDSIKKKEKRLLSSFIVDNRKTLLSSVLLSEVTLSSNDASKIKKRLEVNNRNKELINKLEEEISLAKISEAAVKVQRRKPVPLFSGVNLQGRQTHLKRIIKGKKAFLIDFWASWCPPCREASPKLKALYSKYKRKGFDILTVSEDRSVDEWKSGVFIDDIEDWHHIYDDFNRISSMFNVGALPHMVLIDENGKIIKNKISMQSLENQLAIIFDNK